jgi:diguanylate cyclase (GGDEF)-like protein/PAS domain S-box-containing protein
LAEVTHSVLLDEQNQAIGRLSMVRDVTDAKRAAAALQEAEERFRLTFERAPLGMALVTREGRFIQVNGAFCQMLGMNVAEVVARGVFGITYSEDRELTQQMLQESSAAERIVKRYLHADGHLVSVQIIASPVIDAVGALLYYVSMFEDVTDEQRYHQQLTRQAFYDSLTGLPNRLLFEDRGRQVLARARRKHDTVGILFCDLDDFKAVNDRCGHDAGDEILRQVAVRLQSCAREMDTVARFGGDEFVLLLDGLRETAESMVVAARICDIIAKPYSLGDQSVKVGVSIGVAINSPETSSLETILGKADGAMYQAKAAGGYRTHFSVGPMEIEPTTEES